ncbi:hypothetical protein [Edaphobacter modestus]|uniref:Uncharacterized protein n=1 Tax=Edaphobacter modestus TaxID=388466 RepID=A0A4Q7XYL7_9BACT|nr:hypothetical protein [Edaphobacter modestus]RZU29044.1 hypothetical protein BDD14_6638 [Edaphobacter modestus]
MNKTDPFGSLSEFQPKEPMKGEVNGATLQDMEKVSADHGFSIKNFEEKRNVFRTRRGPRAPKSLPITMRVRVNAWNRFQQYCELNDISVADAFDELTANLPSINGSRTVMSNATNDSADSVVAE